MLEEILKKIVQEKRQEGVGNMMIRNYLKEYIQYLVLSILYNRKDTKKMVFKGGSCLRVCYDLPRLSEDLDFDYDKKDIKTDILEKLDKLLTAKIKKTYFQSLETKIQSDIRLYLKFPILYDIGLSNKSESNKLYVKIETSADIDPFANFQLIPVSKFGFNFILKSYDLSSLMTGKINALLYRVWTKGKDNEIDIKGRDFYDLYWFLQKGVEPNWKMLNKMTGIKERRELYKLLVSRIEKSVTPQKLSYDLENFISDSQFVKDFSKNYKKIIKDFLK